MLISHSHKFLTVDIPKTGTRSYRETLLSAGILEQNTTFAQHATAKDIKEKFENLGLNWNEYFKYTIIRNPWQRYASYFMWAKKLITETSSVHNGPKRLEVIQNFRNLFSTLNFDDKLIFQTIINNEKSQDQYFTNKNDIVLVDYIGKFENLKSEFIHLCTQVGIIPAPDLNHSNSNGNYNYKDFYNQQLIDLVAKKEAYIIQKYGYQYV